MEKKVIIDNIPTPISETKTVLSFKSPSPKWASQVFNVWVGLISIAMLYMATFDVSEEHQLLVGKIIGFGTGVMRIVTKMFGLEVKD